MLSRLKPVVSSLQILALTTLCASFASFASAAQNNKPAQQQAALRSGSAQLASGYRLLNPKEGRVIVNMAWEHDTAEDGVQDCSHVVNQIYRDAGYAYPYANSYDLYQGIAGFVRVRSPHPGDLVTWPGHVGIVLNAREHSFYSLVSTGLAAQDYRGAYWRSRGHARFYRFVVRSSGESNAVVMAQRTAPEHGAAQPCPGRSRGNAAAACAGGPQLAQATEPQQSRLSSVPIGPLQEDATTPPRSVVVAQHAAPAQGASSESTFSADPVNSLKAPPFTATIALTTTSGRPTSDDVSQGITALTNAAGGVLDTEEPLKVITPVAVFERLAVERVDVKRDHGWAQVKIDSRISIDASGVDFKPRHDKVRWELRRSESGWVAVAPAERVYVPRDAAVRIFAARLAQLAQSDAAAQHDDAVLGQEARIANLLSALLESR